jgi:hypothetical protein
MDVSSVPLLRVHGTIHDENFGKSGKRWTIKRLRSAADEDEEKHSKALEAS